MDAVQKTDLCMTIAEECIQRDELLDLFKSKDHIVAYDGFEPSGRVHLAQGILKAVNVNKLTSCGVHFKFWVADWFAQLNNKMDGDLSKIQLLGQYMIEVWKALKMDMSKVEFLWASEEINKRPNEYWSLVMDVARKNNLKRIIRCSQIMGRKESDDLTASQIFYPCMQVADIFFLQADICQLGMDQRKVNMLAREYAVNSTKPIILSHPMLPGLKGQEKMAKSDPKSAIFMNDSESEVNTKIKNALCPPLEVIKNPCMMYIKNLIFPAMNYFEVSDVRYDDYTTFQNDYENGKIHPADLKTALAKAINYLIEPVRIHFATDKVAREIEQQVNQLLDMRH